LEALGDIAKRALPTIKANPPKPVGEYIPRATEQLLSKMN